MAFSYKILTQNGVNFTNIDEARNYWFNSGMRDGIVKGVLNEGTFSAPSSNSIKLDTCELRIGGHRVTLDEAWEQTYTGTQDANTRYALVAQVVIDSNSAVAFSLIVQTANTPLVKDDLYKHENGAGTYQVEIGRFTLTTNGTVEDITRTIDIITGGKSSGDGAINIGNVTTHTLAAGLEAEVDIEQRVNQEDGKTYTDFNFDIPKGDQGDTGATGVGISTITAGTPIVSGGTTTTPITITLTNNTPIVINIVAQNGTNGTNGTNGASVTDVQFTYASTDADGNKVYNVMTTVGNGTPFNSGSITSPKGAKGDTGNTGATGVGVSTITAGTSTQSGNTTITPITVTLTNGNTQSFNVVAQNGANGSNGTNGSNGASVTDVQVIYASTDANGNNIYNVTSTIGGSTVNSGTITAPKGATGAIPTIDSALSTTSTNPVQNKVITNALNNKANSSDIPTIDTALSTTSTNPVRNSVVTKAIQNNWIFSGGIKQDSATNVSDCIFDFELPKTGTYTYTLLVNKNGSTGNGGIQMGIFNDYSDLQNGFYSGWFVSSNHGWKWNTILETRWGLETSTFSATAGEHLLIFAGAASQNWTTKVFTLKLSVN